MKQIAWMVLAVSTAVAGNTPSIDEIMAHVAANQEKSVEARKQFVYRQDELMSLRYSNGKVQCEARKRYTVTPNATGISRHVETAEGKGEDACNVHVDINTSNGPDAKPDSDAENESLRMSFGKSHDGIPNDLFPLTGREQKLYEYRLIGTDTYRGRPVYRVSFRPNHKKDEDGDEGYWKGTTMIDAEEFQPVQVVTDLTAKIPMAVRILLGTNLRGVGFSVSYQRVADGVWFPASFGGEFELRALFFIKRSISINVKNSEFKRTDVKSTVAFGEKEPATRSPAVP